MKESFSRLRKKFKPRGSKGKADRTGADSGGERVDPAGSLLQPVPHVTAGGGHNKEGRASVDGQQIHSMDRPPPPSASEPVPVRGSNDDQEGVEGGVGGGEPGQSHLDPRPDTDTELVVSSGPGWKVNEAEGEKVRRVYPSPSTPSITQSEKPDGM